MESYDHTVKWQVKGKQEIHQSPYGHTKERAEYLALQGNRNFDDPKISSRAYHWAERLNIC